MEEHPSVLTLTCQVNFACFLSGFDHSVVTPAVMSFALSCPQTHIHTHSWIYRLHTVYGSVDLQRGRTDEDERL